MLHVHRGKAPATVSCPCLRKLCSCCDSTGKPTVTPGCCFLPPARITS